MTTTRKIFMPEERLSILQEGELEGEAATIRKYHIAPSLFMHDGNINICMMVFMG
jgi:putative transposase